MLLEESGELCMKTEVAQGTDLSHLQRVPPLFDLGKSGCCRHKSFPE